MKNCDNCTHCWRDDSVGARECTMAEEMTEEEIETYYADMNEGCPYHKTQEELDEEYIMALNSIGPKAFDSSHRG